MAGSLLHAETRARRTELYDIRFEPGADQRRDGHLPGTEELVLCTAGVLEAGPDGATETLRAGDLLWFAADGPHGYRTDAGASALCWMLHG